MKRLFTSIFIFFTFLGMAQSKELKSGMRMLNSSIPEKKTVLLDCYFDFVDSQFIAPGFFYYLNEDKVYDLESVGGIVVKMPHSLPKKQGYGTYHCKIENLKPRTEYGLLPYRSFLPTAVIYVNGNLVYHTKGITKDFSPARELKQCWNIVKFKSDNNGVVDIVIHIANHELPNAGLFSAPRFGETLVLRQDVLKSFSISLSIAGVLLIIIIYNLIIYCLNRNQFMYLYLVLLSLNLLIVTFSLGLSLFSFMQGEVNYVLNHRLKFLALVLVCPLYDFYAIKLYDIRSKLNNFIQTINIAAVGCVLILPFSIVSRLVPLFLSISLINASILAVIIFKKRRKPSYVYIVNVVIISLMVLTAFLGLTVGRYSGRENIGIILFKFIALFFAVVQSCLAGIKRDILAQHSRTMKEYYEKLNDSYARFIPSDILNYLQIEDIKDVELGKSTVCDGLIVVVKLKNFKEIGARLDTKEVFTLLTRYFEIVTNSFSYYGGVVTKYFADGIVGVFEEKNDAACRSAIEIAKQVEELSNVFKEMNLEKLEVKIGIHYGKLAIGFMGTKKYMNAVCTSEEILKAIRIGNLNEEKDSNIIISEEGLQYCRSLTSCMFEGFIYNFDEATKKLLYKVVPFENQNSYNIKY